MTEREVLKLALEALELNEKCSQSMDIQICADASQKTFHAITAIREALAQPEQEPVAFYVYKPTLPRGHLGNVSDVDLPWVYDQDPSSGYSARMLVYTTPPQRKPLTDEEIILIVADCASSHQHTDIHFARAIEAKLKEKNNG